MPAAVSGANARAGAVVVDQLAGENDSHRVGRRVVFSGHHNGAKVVQTWLSVPVWTRFRLLEVGFGSDG